MDHFEHAEGAAHAPVASKEMTTETDKVGVLTHERIDEIIRDVQKDIGFIWEGELRPGALHRVAWHEGNPTVMRWDRNAWVILPWDLATAIQVIGLIASKK